MNSSLLYWVLRAYLGICVSLPRARSLARSLSLSLSLSFSLSFYIYIYIHMFVYIAICARTYIYTYTHAHVHFSFIPFVFYICTHTYSCAYVHIRIYDNAKVCICIYIHTCLVTFINKQLHTCTFTSAGQDMYVHVETFFYTRFISADRLCPINLWAWTAADSVASARFFFVVLVVAWGSPAVRIVCTCRRPAQILRREPTCPVLQALLPQASRYPQKGHV